MKTIKNISILLIAFVLVSINSSAFAQDHMVNTFGIKGGVTVSDFMGDDVGSTDVLAGFTGGIYYNHYLNPIISIQPELIFTQKRTEVRRGFTNNQFAEYDIGYLELPVLVKFNVPTESSLIPNLHTGPSFGLKVYGDENSRDLGSRVEDFEFSWIFGAGLDLMTNQIGDEFIKKVSLDVRYMPGITDVFDLQGDPDVQTSVFAFTLGLGF